MGFLFYAQATAAEELRDIMRVGFDVVREEVGYEESATFEIVVLRIINLLLVYLGLIAFIIVIWGGVSWMMSGGSEEKVGKAKKIMIAGFIGMFIIIAAYAIAKFFTNAIFDIVAQ